MKNPPSPPSEPIILRHPTEPLEVVVPRGSLADLLVRLGYTVVEPEPPDHLTLLFDDERTIDHE